MEILPHRYPFLLVDRVLSIDLKDGNDNKSGNELIALKNVSINESFFVGHFPDRPVMPGVLLIEAIAQAAILLLHASGGISGKICFLTTIESAKFRHPVVPGDTLLLQVKSLGERRNIYRASGKAVIRRYSNSSETYVDITAAEAVISAALVDEK